MAFPNVRLTNRPLHFIYLCDCSGSMAAQGKMQALNQAIRQSLPGMAEVARQNPEARVLIRAVSFADRALWHIADPTPVGELSWTDLQAGGITAMGEALELVASQLSSPPMEERALPPVLVFPEGTTCGGGCVVGFRSGAFVGVRPSFFAVRSQSDV
jgi:Mg-chelatase subunit ChlD